MDRVDNLATVPLAPPLPMNSIWRTIRGYVLWSHERGSLHYDIMVTLILLFVFLSPMVINFNDKPIQRSPQATGVTVTPDGAGGLVRGAGTCQPPGPAYDRVGQSAARDQIVAVKLLLALARSGQPRHVQFRVRLN